MQIYIVQPGDSVNGIAASHQISPESVIYNNQIPYPYRLAIGEALLLSTGPNPAPRTNIRSNGYAYPYISPWVLEQSLPYLTELSVFSYGFTHSGDLLPPSADDTWMVNAAIAMQTLPVLTLTPLGPDGMFDNTLISSLVQSSEAKNNLLTQLLAVMGAKGYRSLDIDFEYIKAEDRDAFTIFVQDAVSAMHTSGYTVSVALAPKTSADQPGLLYEGKDYRALGEAADRVLLMTYEWGYKYGPNMAVAPLNMVRRVVEYAVTEIPPEKIYLGIPNYGYDWPLPFVRGVTAATTIGSVEAVQIAITHGVPIQFDETAMSPFFRYVNSGVEHEVWFEDVRSLQAKFSLIREFGLSGAGYWQIMRLFRAGWLLLADTFWITRPESF